MTDRPGEPLEQRPDQGGDAACWLNEVCPRCGALVDGETCWRCGAPRSQD